MEQAIKSAGAMVMVGLLALSGSIAFSAYANRYAPVVANHNMGTLDKKTGEICLFGSTKCYPLDYVGSGNN